MMRKKTKIYPLLMQDFRSFISFFQTIFENAKFKNFWPLK